MRNFILAEAPAIRKESHLLLHTSSDIEDKDREVVSFSHYSRWLLRKGYSTNTITKYSENVANFLDYLFEASKSDALLSEQLDFEDVIYSYESFMLFGKQASNAYSRPRLPLIPVEACHPFHAKAATDSTATLPPRQVA